MNKPWLITLLSVVGGVTALSALAMAIWNSKQMRTARVLKRTKAALYQAGTVLRVMSGMETD